MKIYETFLKKVENFMKKYKIFVSDLKNHEKFLKSLKIMKKFLKSLKIKLRVLFPVLCTENHKISKIKT